MSHAAPIELDSRQTIPVGAGAVEITGRDRPHALRPAEAQPAAVLSGSRPWTVRSSLSTTLEAMTPVDPADPRERVAWLLHRSADAALLTNVQGVIQYVNPAFEAMTGYSASDAVGRTPSILKSGRQSPAYYQRLWGTLLAGQEFCDVIINRRRDGECFHEEKVIRPLFDSRGRISHFLSAGRDVSQRVATDARLQRAATHDPLTDVPNRSFFAERLAGLMQRARRDGDRFTVALVDVNDFKLVNDLYGHAAGDAVLRQVARRLQLAVREGDTVARLGGDEFGLVLAGAGDAVSIDHALRKVVAVFDSPVLLPDGRALAVSASIGACIRTLDDHDEQRLLERADAAMYRAKREGGPGYCLFGAEVGPPGLQAVPPALPRGLDVLLDLLDGRVPVRRRRLKVGDTIYRAGQACERLFLLTAGSATLTRAGPAGGAQRVDVTSRGDWLGLDGIATGRHEWEAVVTAPGEVLAVDYGAILRLARQVPSVYPLLMEAMGRQLTHAAAIDRSSSPP